MGDRYERGDPIEAYETFDAIHAAGMAPTEFPGELEDDSPLEGRHGAGAPSLMSYGASSTLRYEPGADAIPTSVTMPAGAEPASPVPEPSPSPQDSEYPLTGRAAASAARHGTDHVHKIMRESVYNTWNDGKTAPRALWLEMNRAPRAHPSPPPAEPPPVREPALQALGADLDESTPRVTEWTVEIDETQTPATRAASRAGRGSRRAQRAGDRGRSHLAHHPAAADERGARDGARHRRQPLVADDAPQRTTAPDGGHPGGRLSDPARATIGVETAHMARALRRAAGVSASTARDYATERAALAQEALSGALDTTRGGATGAWRTVSRIAPGQTQWLTRAFNAGRYAGRIEQRLK